LRVEKKNCEHILDLINIGLVDRDTVEAMNRLLKILYGDELPVVDVDFLKKEMLIRVNKKSNTAQTYIENNKEKDKEVLNFGSKK
jgi:hypothetical protein